MHAKTLFFCLINIKWVYKFGCLNVLSARRGSLIYEDLLRFFYPRSTISIANARLDDSIRKLL